jgi:hypothetical protein
MNKTPLLLAGAVSALGIAALLAWTAPSTGQAPRSDCEPYKLNTPLTADLIKPGMLPPCAPNVSPQGGGFPDPLDNLQHGFDLYSWLTFVALNSPDDGKDPIGKGSGPTVWQNYKQLADVMLPNGREPKSWEEKGNVDGIRGHVPRACLDKAKAGMMVIHMEEETFNQPFKSGPLIDQNGNYALFDILMNREMFQFIRDNGLYNKQGQERFPGEVDFARGANGGGPLRLPQGIGAIMVKVSWKVLANDDERSKFHSIEGLIFTRDKSGDEESGTCEVKTLGLVGFHVGHKTEAAPQWVWTTFEHVANVPEQDDINAGTFKRDRYNFYDRGCTQCPVNQTPPFPWNPSVEPFPNGFKSQITRVIPVTKDAKKINDDSHAVAGIKGTVWENYMLVSTQWPSDFGCATSRKPPGAQPDPTCSPAPTFLPNATLETYSQGLVPQASSSCIGCHNNATSQHNPATQSDFTFMLEKARPLRP